MIEEVGTVVGVQGNTIWVETKLKTSCGSCVQESSCATGTIAKAFTPKPEHIELVAPNPLSVGQQVKLGIHEQHLVKLSSFVYLVPLMISMSILFLVTLLFDGIHELIAFSFAALAFYLAIVFVSRYMKQRNASLKPIFLGAIISATELRKHEIPTQKIY